MAHRTKADVADEVATLRTRLQQSEAALAKRQHHEEEMHQALAEAAAEIDRLKIDLQKSRRAGGAPPVGAGDAPVSKLLVMIESACLLAHELKQPITAIANYAHAGLQMLA